MSKKQFFSTIKKIFQQSHTNSDSGLTQPNQQEEQKLLPTLESNLQKIKNTLGNSSDLITREIKIANNIKAVVIYTDGMIDTVALHDLFDSLMNNINLEELHSNDASIAKTISKSVITFGEVEEIRDFNTLVTNILSGQAAILIDKEPEIITVNIPGHEKRGVEEPQSATTVKGPRDGFTETLSTNTALLRRRIRSSDFWLESKEIGKVTKTRVVIAYIKGIANDDIVEEVRQRLDKIEIDAILESGNIEEFIEDDTFTPFPTVFSTERPDAVAGKLLEGRVAILVDGSPFVLVVPSLFVEFLQASEDYYYRADIATLLRLLRFLCLFIALLAPSFYIALLTYHHEMLPTKLLVSIAAQREGVPFPVFLEALIMEITFEILREAGVRMPRAVGQAMSIVGALVLGQAAVQAGIVSNVMVVVVAITAIANFCFPAVNLAISIRIIRFVMMLLAAGFGLVGIMFGLILLCIHLCSLRSFGVPYMTPVAPFVLQDQKDVYFRVPIWAMISRPRLISQNNINRNNTSSKAQENE